MARKPRLHVPGGLYHVILRGNAQQDIFFSPHDRKLFYELLQEGIARFGYRVHAFCLMTNHVHLALQAGDQILSAGMQNLSFRYTRYANGRLQRVGHLFQGRFKAFLVDQDAYGLSLVRYIHLNPVRAKLVSQAAAYAWSSHRAYLGQQTLPWLTTDWVLGQFGTTVTLARKRFAPFVEEGRGEGHQGLFYGGASDARIVGEEDFVRSVLKIKPSRTRRPQLKEITAYVCAAYSLTLAELLAEGRERRRAEARALLAYLAIKSHAASLTALARYFERETSTLAHAVSRLAERSRKSQDFASALSNHLYAISQA
jgi:REP-associated tyrosine transposase